ncbi:MAG TPA: hypothetical protein VHF88_05015 [Thermoleophilaceae bacterium]|nr:hypothetical protein [Thermoleophilaceae bacterium]
MSDWQPDIDFIDVPVPGKIEEHGISIDAPMPDFHIANPWGVAPSAPPANGAAPQPSAPSATADDA